MTKAEPIELAFQHVEAILGTPYLQGDEQYAELPDIYVYAPFRRQGVARALIAHVEAVARAAGASGLVIITGFHICVV